MSRKAIQISAAPDEVYALCDDGTVWRRRGDSWELEPEIPQESIAERRASKEERDAAEKRAAMNPSGGVIRRR